MSLTVQNLRAVTAGAEPASLLPGQLCFNVADKIMFVGDGSDTKTRFDGTSSVGIPGEGWFSMPMDFSQFSVNFIVNPEVYGDIPTDGQVLTWDQSLGHTTWTNGGSTSNLVYGTTNDVVAAAPGSNLTLKINNAIGVASPDPNDWVVVAGLPGDVFQGLYYFDTTWIKAANYSFPTAAEVPYDNDVSGLSASSVQTAIDQVDNLTNIAQATANAANAAAGIAQDAADTAQTTADQAVADAAAAQATADAALPKAGGTLTGNLFAQQITATTVNTEQINVESGYGITFAAGAQGTIFGITGSVSNSSITLAASASAVRTAYNAAITAQGDAAAAQSTADAAIPRSSFSGSGQLLVGSGAGTFSALSAGPTDYLLASGGSGSLVWVPQSEGDVTTVSGTAPIVVDNLDPQNPVVGVDLATTAAPGVVQIELTGNLTLVGGVIDVPDASTTVKGAVQLNNTLSSNSITEALTAAQGAALQGQIDTLLLSNSVTLAGGYDASSGLVVGATSQGQSVGFQDGNPPPAASATNVDYYLIATTSGTIPSAMQNGDWLLSVQTGPTTFAYQVLGVGARPQQATYLQAGIVQLANAAAVLAGTSDSTAITPKALQDNIIDSVTTANSSQMASATAVKTAYDAGILGQTQAAAAQATANAALPKAGGTMTGNISFQDSGEGVVFSGGSQLFAISDSTATTSSTTGASSTAVKSAYDLANAAIPKSTLTACGDILVATDGAAPSALPLGVDGQVLVVNTACATGLEWVSDTPGDVTSVTGNAPIVVDNTDPQNPIVSIDAATLVSCGAVQLSDSLNNSSDAVAATAGALCTTYALADQANTTANAAIPCASFLAKGNLLGGTSAGNFSALAVGTNGQVLIADSACTTGLKWGNACYVPDACFTAAGQIIVGTGAGTYVALPVGTDCQTLVVNSACTATGGVTWGVSLTGYTCAAAVGNTALGVGAGDSITTGLHNTAVGSCAGTSISAGDNNTLVGWCTGDGLTSGNNNTAVGALAFGNTGGSNNTIMGYCAGAGITTGNSNTLVGSNAGDAIAGGNSIVGVGQGVLGGAVTAAGTVAIGATAGAALTSGANTTLVGFAAGDSITTGARNTVVGHTSGGALTTGADNTIIGALAGNLTTGTGSTILGSCAGAALTLGGANVFLGAGAGDLVTTGFNNTIIGDVGGSTTLTGNAILAAGTTVKFQANNAGAWSYNGTDFGAAGQFLASQGSGATPLWCTLSLACVPCSAFTAVGNLLVGTGASTFTALPVGTNGQVLVADSACTSGVKWDVGVQGYTCGSATFNTAYGCQAGDSITTGTDNVALGYNAGTAQVAGSQSVFIGSGAGQSTNAGGVTAIGFCAAQGNISAGCGTYIGFVAGRNATSVSNTYVGALSGCAASNTSACGTFLGFCSGSAVTTGNGNTFLGHQTGRFVTTGCFNVAIGVATFQSATTGVCNVAIGCGALGGNITGNGSTAIGTRALGNTSGTAVNTAVGSEAGVQTTGTGNSYFGVNAGCAVNTGTCNTLIGRNSGTAITTGSCNTIVGSFAGSTTLANNVVLADGAGTVRFQANSTGAWSPNGTNFGTAGQVLKSAGTSAAPAWSSALYGAFSDSSIQTNDDLVNGNAVTLDTTASTNGFSIVSGSQITATTAGVYNIQISLQVEKTDAGTDTVEVWFKKNGTNIANSNTNIQLEGNGAKQLLSLNLIEPMTVGQYLEVWWYSADADVQLTSVAAGTRPAIPSAIVTIVPVGA